MERVSQPLRRERVADAIDCQREMRLQQIDIDATIGLTRKAIADSRELLARIDKGLSRLR
jgi:hypothetical protein